MTPSPTPPTGDPDEVEARLSMPLRAAMETQRAVRRLTAEPVDDAVVLRLLELAQKAPSGGNRQPQRYLVVRDAAVKEDLARRNRVAWGLLRRLYRPSGRTAAQRRLIEAVDWQAEHFAEAPVVVIVCAKGRAWGWPPALASAAYGSVYPSVQNLLLAARAVGLGAALTTLPVWSARGVRRLLGLPRGVRPVCAVPLGWPRGRYGPTTRRPVGTVTHLDRYGNRPFLESRGRE